MRMRKLKKLIVTAKLLATCCTITTKLFLELAIASHFKNLPVCDITSGSELMNVLFFSYDVEGR